MFTEKANILKRNVLFFFFNFYSTFSSVPLPVIKCQVKSQIVIARTMVSFRKLMFKVFFSSNIKCMLNTMLKGGTDLSLDTHHNRVKNSSPPCSNSSLLPLRLLPHPLTFRPETRGGRAGVIVNGTGLTPPTPEAHRISITSLYPRKCGATSPASG